MPFEYDMPLYRPPSEARSLIFQVTLGCSWNQCSFCEMYTSKTFKARPEQKVLDEISQVSKQIQGIRKVFLADGNPLVLSTDRLSTILDHLNQCFPQLQRISTYALPKDILSKSSEELAVLRAKGLKLIYLGIESGDDQVLKMVNKGETSASTIKGLTMAKEAGLKTSVMILTGLGGKTFSQQHAIHSAKVVNAVQPDYLSTLVLMFPFGLDHYQKRFQGQYIPLELEDVLTEMETFIGHTQLQRTIFRSDHASNYLALKGVLGRDKEELLDTLRQALKSPHLASLRDEWQRGL